MPPPPTPDMDFARKRFEHRRYQRRRSCDDHHWRPRRKSGGASIGLSPETAKKLVKLGAKVLIRSDAGLRSHFSDEDYRSAGAEIVAADADAVQTRRHRAHGQAPILAQVQAMKPGAMLIAMLDPYSDADGLRRWPRRAPRCSPWS